MRPPFVATLVLFASFTILGTGCAAADGADLRDLGEAESLATASSTPLSMGLLCAAVSAAENNSQGDGLVKVPQSKLKADALHDFKLWQRGMVDDYPSEAFELPVTIGTRTYTFLMVSEMNDGGGAVGLYRTDGSVVATDVFSESGGQPWSSPASECEK